MKGRTRFQWRHVAVALMAASLVGATAVPSIAARPHRAPTAYTQYKPVKGPYTIGYDIYYDANSWSQELALDFKYAVSLHKKLIKHVYYTSSNGSSVTQVQNLQDLITKHVNLIIVSPISPTGIEPVIAQARRDGIAVVVMATPAAGKQYSAFVNVNDFAFGKVGAQWLANKLHGKGNIIVLNGLAGYATSEERWAGAESVFKHYPGIKVVGSAYAGWAFAPAKAAVANLLAAHPVINGVWSQGGAMTAGAVAAFQAAHRPLVPMTGEDYNGFLKVWAKLKPKGFDSIAPAKPTWLATRALDVGLAILEGKRVLKNQFYHVPVITSKTVNKYVRWNLPNDVFDNTNLPVSWLKKFFG